MSEENLLKQAYEISKLTLEKERDAWKERCLLAEKELQLRGIRIIPKRNALDKNLG